MSNKSNVLLNVYSKVGITISGSSGPILSTGVLFKETICPTTVDVVFDISFTVTLFN